MTWPANMPRYRTPAQATIEKLEAVGRTRALTMSESLRLERAIRSEDERRLKTVRRNPNGSSHFPSETTFCAPRSEGA